MLPCRLTRFHSTNNPNLINRMNRISFINKVLEPSPTEHMCGGGVRRASSRTRGEETPAQRDSAPAGIYVILDLQKCYFNINLQAAF